MDSSYIESLRVRLEKELIIARKTKDHQRIDLEEMVQREFSRVYNDFMVENFGEDFMPQPELIDLVDEYKTLALE